MDVPDDHPQNTTPTPAGDVAEATTIPAADTPGPHSPLVFAALMACRMDKATQAQVALLKLRATALRLSSIPPVSPEARRYAALAAALLADEDDDRSSYARLMIERAIMLADTHPLEIGARVATGTRSGG